MKGIHRKFGFVVLALACVVAPFVIRHWTRLESKTKNDLIQEQAQRLANLRIENESLSNRVAQATAAALSNNQLSELLRLRSEIGPLRDIAKEVETLRAANQELTSRPQPNEKSVALSSPDPAAVQAYWPRDQLASAGYQDPVSALKTALWAMSRGDADALVASVTTTAKSRLTREEWLDHGDPADEIAKASGSIARSLGVASGFYVVGPPRVSEDDAILDVFFDGEGKTRKIAMKRIGAEWKLNRMGRAGGDDQEVRDGDGVWP